LGAIEFLKILEDYGLYPEILLFPSSSTINEYGL